MKAVVEIALELETLYCIRQCRALAEPTAFNKDLALQTRKAWEKAKEDARKEKRAQRFLKKYLRRMK